MARALPPLTWFRSFEAAARHLSFTAAAEEISLTQSAVSQQVKSLETRFGVALFSRRPRGLALTDEGRKLLPQVSAALQTLAAASMTFEGGADQNTLTIATSVSVAQWVIAPRLREFTQAYPDIAPRLLSAIWPDDFHSASADVQIRFSPVSHVETDAEVLRPNRLVALKSPKLAGALEDLPLIETVGTSSGWKAWGETHGAVGHPTLFTDTYGMALHMATQTNGVALVSALLAEHALDSGQVVRAHEGTLPAQEAYVLSIDEANPHAAAFRDWLHSILPNR